MKEAHHINKVHVIVFGVMLEKSGDLFRLITGNSVLNQVSMYSHPTKHGSFSDHPVFAVFTSKTEKYNHRDYQSEKLQKERYCFKMIFYLKLNRYFVFQCKKSTWMKNISSCNEKVI